MSGRGQVSVLGALLLLAFMMAFLAIWGAVMQWVDAGRIESSVRVAALAGASALDRTSLASGTTQLDPTAAEAQARTALARSLALSFPPGPHAVVDAAAATAAAHIDVYNATLTTPLTDPDPAGGGKVFHYATVCVTLDVSVGVVTGRGVAVPHHFHGCAQSV